MHQDRWASDAAQTSGKAGPEHSAAVRSNALKIKKNLKTHYYNIEFICLVFIYFNKWRNIESL
jgi:hypothetical protein